MLQKNPIWQSLVTHIIDHSLNNHQKPIWNQTLKLLRDSPQDVLTALELHVSESKDWVAHCVELNRGLDIANLIKHFSLYEELYTCIDDYFTNLTNHVQHRELANYYKHATNTEAVIHLWALSIFTGLTSVQAVITLKESKTTKILSAVIEQAAINLLTYTELLSKQQASLKLITFKKYIHILVRKFGSQNQNYYTIRIEDKREIMNLHDLLQESKPIAPYARQVTVISLLTTFDINEDRRFNISTTAPHITTIGINHYVHTEFILGGHNLIIQHYAKNPTTIQQSFITAARHLGETSFTLDSYLATRMNELVHQEITRLWNVISELTEESVEDIYQAKSSLRRASKEVYHTKHIRGFLQQLFVDNATVVDEGGTIGALAKKTNINASILKSIFKKNKQEQQLIFEAQKLQQSFSHLLLYTNFISYLTYINMRGIHTLYFLPYSDFRGRLYYKSEASPQSLWCFRFLYYYRVRLPQRLDAYPMYTYQLEFLTQHPEARTENPAVIEFIHAIGVIFKSEVINQETGELSLRDVLTLGYKRYCYYQNYDFIKNENNLDLKDLTELFYYVYAYQNESNSVQRGYYIWKDTTASVAQHGGKLLGYKTDSLKYLNLDNQFVAYDTYQVIILALKRRLAQDYGVAESCLNLLNRKTLKQLIMTCEYQVSYQTAYNRYIHLIETHTAKDEKYRILNDQTIFKAIYTSLGSGLVAELFYTETQDEWLNKLGNTTIKFQDISFDHNYYVIDYKSLYYDLDAGEKRHRAVLKTIVPHWESSDATSSINKQKTKQAAYVNFVHAYDAEYLRALLRAARETSIEMAAIHDGFGVAYYNSKWLIGAANDVFWTCPSGVTSLTILT